MVDTIIRGVNLGGWLVLEKWMTPGLFEGSKASDEFTFCSAADKKQLAKLQTHRQTFITEADFAWIAEHGLNAVRIPVGYWLFGDVTPYVGAVEFLDKAFDWADKYHLKVLLSVHGVPGSQNGQDHSGRAGDIGWAKDDAHISQSLRFVQQLAEKYGDAPALWGIELLNEPSPKLPKRVLKKYYQDAYEVIRETAGNRPAIVFSDGFKPRRWKRVLRGPTFEALIDTHQYGMVMPRDKRRTVQGHISKVALASPRLLSRMSKHHRVIVGEWSAALDNTSFRNLTDLQKSEAYRAYASAQLLAYEQTAGWFYWSYKTEGNGPWNFRSCVESGVLPTAFKS